MKPRSLFRAVCSSFSTYSMLSSLRAVLFKFVSLSNSRISCERFAPPSLRLSSRFAWFARLSQTLLFVKLSSLSREVCSGSLHYSMACNYARDVLFIKSSILFQAVCSCFSKFIVDFDGFVFFSPASNHQSLSSSSLSRSSIFSHFKNLFRASRSCFSNLLA